MATPAGERRDRALEAAKGERPTRGPRLTPDELARLELRRRKPRVAELLTEPDPGPIPGPRGVRT